jgi:hypothetical protein
LVNECSIGKDLEGSVGSLILKVLFLSPGGAEENYKIL